MNKRNLLSYLDETAHRYPDKTALRDGADSLTFRQLHRKAEAIGSSLVKMGFFRQAVIVLMDKHPDTVCAFLGVLNSGCFYICVDPEMPDSRIRAIAEKTQTAAVISNSKSRERAALLYGRAEVLDFDELLKSETDTSALRAVRGSTIDADPAYIVFTSGTTGDPKGVCVSHRSLVDYADALTSTLPFDSDTVFGNQAPLYYDAPLKELLPMLVLGACVVFLPNELFAFPIRLCEYIRQNGINTLCFAASALAMISSLKALDVCDMSHLRCVCFGSEVMPSSELEKWRRACPKTTFINLYGPTEATGMSAYWIADRHIGTDEQIPIGKPFPNAELILINDDGKECLDGEEGEILIRGTCVALGYYHGVTATETAFVQNPLQSAYPELVYRTGDMARRNSRGELVYLGRRDRQIKLMGRRIEPREIECAALECSGVIMPTLFFDPNRQRMTLFYMGELEERAVASHLSMRLPRYMLPHKYRRLEILPQLPNGKIDTASLCRMI